MNFCSKDKTNKNPRLNRNKLYPEQIFEEMGFGWFISANENFVVATSYDKLTYLFRSVNGFWKQDYTEISEGYTLHTDMSDKYIAVSYLNSYAEKVVKIMNFKNGSWTEDKFFKPRSSVYEELSGGISISNKHLIIGYRPHNSHHTDKFGVLIYTKHNKRWKLTAKIEPDKSDCDYDFFPRAISDEFAFVSFMCKGSGYIRVLHYGISGWHTCKELGPFKNLEFLDASNKYLAIGRYEGESVNRKSVISIYELYNDSISSNPILSNELKDSWQDFKICDDQILILNESNTLYMDDQNGNTRVSLYQIRDNGLFKIAKPEIKTKDLQKNTDENFWEYDGFEFSVGLNSQYMFIGVPKDDEEIYNQGSVYILKY